MLNSFSLSKLRTIYPNSSNWWVYVSVLLILLSIKIISVKYSICYNSDVAIHILMIDRFEFLVDNYIWGETYLGSLFPMVGCILKDLFGINSLQIAFLLQYGCLMCTWYFVQKIFLKNVFSKILLCVALFYPPVAFYQLTAVGHSYLSSFPFFFISIYYIKKYIDTNFENERYLILFYFFTLLASWVNEYFFFLNFIISAFLVFYLFFKGFKSRLVSFSIVLIFNVLIVLIRLFLKSTNRSQYYNENYNKINNFNDFLETIKLFWGIYYEALLNLDLYAISTAVLILIILIALVTDFKKNKLKSRYVNINTLFILSLLISYLFATILSHWTLVQGKGAVRFLSASYFFFILFTLNFVDVDFEVQNDQGLFNKKYLFYFLLTLYVLIGSSSILTRFFDLNYKKASANDINFQLVENKLSDKCLVGGYWESYMLSAATSSNATAAVTSFDNLVQYRDNFGKRKVFENKDIYLVRNRVFENFPDTLNDNGYTYLKTDDMPIVIHYDTKIYLQHYKNLSYQNGKFIKKFNNKIIHSWVGAEVLDSTIGKPIWKVEMDKLDQNFELIHIFTHIDRGEYEYKIKMKFVGEPSFNKNLVVRFSDNVNTELSVTNEISKDSLNSDYKIYNGKIKVPEDMQSGLIQIFGEKSNQKCDFYISELELIRNDK